MRLQTLIRRLSRPAVEPVCRYHELRPRFAEKDRVYRALGLIRAQYGYADLSSCELRVFSQNGEDGVLAELFSRLGVADGYFVEFGVEDGNECNTRFLSDVRGWAGLLLEADPGDYERLARRHANNERVETVQAYVTPDSVARLLSGVPRDLDLLSIDIDGQDYWVWKALPASLRPKVVVIEYNAGLRNGDRLVEPAGTLATYPPTAGFGASLDALVALGMEKGYKLVHLEMTGVNAFFVRDDLDVGAAAVTRRAPNYHLEGLSHPEVPQPRWTRV